MYCKVIRQNFVFYLKTCRFYYSEFISYHFLSWDIKFLIPQKLLIFISKILWFYFITSNDFFEICLSKRKCLDNLDFFELFF